MEWFYPVLWLALIILFVVLEASTVQLVSIWLAAGSLAALIPAMLGMPLVVQVIVFVAVSAVCLVFLWIFIILIPVYIAVEFTALPIEGGWLAVPIVAVFAIVSAIIMKKYKLD